MVLGHQPVHQQNNTKGSCTPAQLALAGAPEDALRGAMLGPARAAFSLREFHEQVMRNGIAPIWAHRELLLPGDTAAALQ